jgi:hypothetical protein
MEDFIPLELALKLKEKGFNIPFYFYYRTDEKPLLHHANVTNPLVYCDKIDDEVVIAPTIYQVLKWLREEKKIHIYMDVCKEGWFFEVKCLRSLYMINTVLFDKHKSYEQAALAGIKYVIDNNLI